MATHGVNTTYTSPPPFFTPPPPPLPSPPSVLWGAHHSGEDAHDEGASGGQGLHRGAGEKRYRPALPTATAPAAGLGACWFVHRAHPLPPSLPLFLPSLKGLAIEGLYRVSGMTSEVLQIKKEFDRGELGCCRGSTLGCQEIQ